MAASNDRRVRRTRAALQRALHDLVLEKRYESITITDILDRADVGRSTFYTHFTDKDDLLLSALDHITAEIDAATHADGTIDTTPLFAHAGTHIELYRALSRGPAGALFDSVA